jgi:aminopeptidase N
MMRQLIGVYWSLLSPEQRNELAPALEKTLWQAARDKNRLTGIKRIYFRTYANLALSDESLSRLRSVWDKSLDVTDLKLATRDFTNLAATLAIKIPDQAEEIIASQNERIIGPDDQRRFEFIQYALSPDQEIRDKFFAALLLKENRHTESWVLSALNYLHHPLRAENSEKYLKRSLEILQEIQITGDIFFPGRWLGATFKYYQSDSAVQKVRDFLAERPDYNKQLRLKILQEADKMFRANKILKNGNI